MNSICQENGIRFKFSATVFLCCIYVVRWVTPLKKKSMASIPSTCTNVFKSKVNNHFQINLFAAACYEELLLTTFSLSFQYFHIFPYRIFNNVDIWYTLSKILFNVFETFSSFFFSNCQNNVTYWMFKLIYFLTVFTIF